MREDWVLMTPAGKTTERQSIFFTICIGANQLTCHDYENLSLGTHKFKIKMRKAPKEKIAFSNFSFRNRFKFHTFQNETKKLNDEKMKMKNG